MVWLAERVSGRDLKAWLRDITDGAGLKHGLHVTLDRDFVPVLSGGGSLTLSPREHHRYHNQSYTDGTIVGHGGFAGQYLMARPDKEAIFGFFSTLVNTHASDLSYLGEVIHMAEDILASL